MFANEVIFLFVFMSYSFPLFDRQSKPEAM